MPYTAVPSGQLHYECRGTGSPLLMVSGLGGVASFWTPQRPRFEKRFTVITYDHRGSGRSTRSPPPYSMHGMSDDVLALLDHLQLDRVRFVGHSTGGAIGQILAARHADRIDRLVLSATWSHPDPYFHRLFTLRRDLVLQAGTDFYTRLSTLMLYPPDWIAAHDHHLVEEHRALDKLQREIIASKLGALLEFDGRAALPNIGCPTLVVAARDDATVPSYLSVMLSQGIRNARLTMLGSGGHYVPISRAEAFGHAIEPFLLE